MPIDYNDYPPNWKSHIRPTILKRANNCCEGSPLYPNCRAKNRCPHPETGSEVVLTIAHLNHNLFDNEPANLRAWCQRCHLAYDRPEKARKRAERKNKNQLKLF